MLLGSLGADVIKVESPQWGDGIRSVYRQPGQKIGVPFALMNSNKRSITLNLKSDEGKEIFKRLVKKADVVVENYEAGTMDRMGLGYDVLKEINPRLIYASGTGYGQSGPNRNLPAFDPIIQAESGIMAVTGEADGPPLKAGVVIVDVLGATHLCAGILAALRYRDRTGKGVTVEISMQEAALPTLAMQVGAYGMGIRQLREGNGSAGGVLAPYNTYPARDGWISIMAAQPARFRRLCELMGQPELADDPRYVKLAGRSRHRAELDRAIAQWTIDDDPARADGPAGRQRRAVRNRQGTARSDDRAASVRARRAARDRPSATRTHDGLHLAAAPGRRALRAEIAQPGSGRGQRTVLHARNWDSARQK